MAVRQCLPNPSPPGLPLKLWEAHLNGHGQLRVGCLAGRRRRLNAREAGAPCCAPQGPLFLPDALPVARSCAHAKG